jgi:hypothetical protein
MERKAVNDLTHSWSRHTQPGHALWLLGYFDWGLFYFVPWTLVSLPFAAEDQGTEINFPHD